MYLGKNGKITYTYFCWSYARMQRLLLLVILLFSQGMAASLTCDVISQDLYVQTVGKTHSCECRICFDTVTLQRQIPTKTDTIQTGYHWAYLSMQKNDPSLNTQAIQHMQTCQLTGSSGHITSNDILLASSSFWSSNEQSQFCRKIV